LNERLAGGGYEREAKRNAARLRDLEMATRLINQFGVGATGSSRSSASSSGKPGNE
jgi:hypothetical protein